VDAGDLNEADSEEGESMMALWDRHNAGPTRLIWMVLSEPGEVDAGSETFEKDLTSQLTFPLLEARGLSTASTAYF